MTALLVALGAGIGAPLRFHLATRLDARFPFGTFVVNVVGSLLLGFFSARALDEQAWALVATGFCGGLTTYSAFAVQTVRLGTWTPRSACYATATIVTAVGAAALGFFVGS